MSEPTSFTGRHNAAWYKGVDDGQLVYGELVGPSDVAAVRAEARATAEAQRDRALIELDRLIGVIQSGIDERGVLNAASKAEAALAATPASSRFLDLDAPETVERLSTAIHTSGLCHDNRAKGATAHGLLDRDARTIVRVLREPGVVDSTGDDRPAPAPAHAVEAEGRSTQPDSSSD